MIVYYTDGSASPNPGPGGFSVIKNGVPHILGSEDGETTNIRMEGKAILAALKDSAGEHAEIFTDSEFWINVITKWAPNWEAKGWKKSGGPIKKSRYCSGSISALQSIQRYTHVGTRTRR